MSINSKLGIWENTSCLQCGACCIDVPNSGVGKCKRQIIENGKSYCLLHGKSKPEGCKKYFCSGYEPDEEEEMRQIAVRLGTVPTHYIS